MSSAMAVRKDTLDRLSLVIVTWNGDAVLGPCLDSIRRVYGRLPETVVVDNADCPSTCELVAAYDGARYVALPENRGFAGGNNAALPFCTREYILLLNNDTVLHERSFDALVGFLDAHPTVGIVQGTMSIPGFGLDDCGTLMTPVGVQRHLHRGDPVATTPLAPRRVTAAKGAMLMTRRAVIDVTGFLFYDHFKSYFEETDFCRRAANAGWETWFVPTPPIDHLCGTTSGRFARDEIWVQYFRNIIYSFARNWGLWGRYGMLPLFCCAAFLKSPRNLLRALAAAFRPAAAPRVV